MNDTEDVYRWLLARLYRAFWRIKLANSEPARIKAEARRMAGNTPTLTDAEREAIELFATLEWTSMRWSKVEKNAATLRKLLERLK